MLVHNFVMSSHFSKVSVLTIRVTDFCCRYVSTPSLVKLRWCELLGMRRSNSFALEIRFLRSHMAGLDGSVTSSHLFCSISEKNGTATLIL